MNVGWISINDAMPKFGQNVFVSYLLGENRYYDVLHIEEIVYRHAANNSTSRQIEWGGSDFSGCDVDYWHPIPEIPK